MNAAIEKTTEQAVRAAFAGRTDAGVHAAHQIISVAWQGLIPQDRIGRALNQYLPSDVAVRIHQSGDHVPATCVDLPVRRERLVKDGDGDDQFTGPTRRTMRTSSPP